MQARENDFTLEQLELATGYSLDVFGGYCEIPRYACEPDSSFRNRIRAHAVKSILAVPRSANAIRASDATLRDYFAAKATMDDINEMRYQHLNNIPEGCEFKPLSWFEAKYAYADAMLAERAK